MSYTYAERKKAAPRAGALQKAAPERMDALARGMVKPTAAEMGHRVDLPEAMRAKMEASFGADLSAVRLYESQAVGDAGAEAVTRGSSIAFAPGKLDFASAGGQALLGHELSHVVSQQRGEVTGGGFLNDRALEARADREGAMAARGESVTEGYGGATAPLSAATAASAAGPMQAKCGKGPTAESEAKKMMTIQMASPYGISGRHDAYMDDRLAEFDPAIMEQLLMTKKNAAQDVIKRNNDKKSLYETLPYGPETLRYDTSNRLMKKMLENANAQQKAAWEEQKSGLLNEEDLDLFGNAEDEIEQARKVSAKSGLSQLARNEQGKTGRKAKKDYEAMRDSEIPWWKFWAKKKTAGQNVNLVSKYKG